MSVNNTAVIYCRVATAHIDCKSDAIVNQEQRGRDYAKRQDYDVVGAFHDVTPAPNANRSGFSKMLAFLNEHRTEKPVVIIDSPSILARDVTTYTTLRNALAAGGASLRSPAFESDDKIADGGLPESFYAAMAEYEMRLQQRDAEVAPIKRLFKRIVVALFPRAI